MHFPSRHVSQHRRASFRAHLSGSRYGQATSVEDPFGYLGELRWIGWDLVILRPLKLLSDFRKHKPHPSWYSLEPVASLGWPTVHWRRSLRKTVIPKLSSKSSHINPYQCPTVKMDGLSMFIQVEKDQMVQWSPKSYSQVPSQSDPWFHQGFVPPSCRYRNQFLPWCTSWSPDELATHDPIPPVLGVQYVKGVAPQELHDATLFIVLEWFTVQSGVWRCLKASALLFRGWTSHWSPKMFEGLDKQL